MADPITPAAEPVGFTEKELNKMADPKDIFEQNAVEGDIASTQATETNAAVEAPVKASIVRMTMALPEKALKSNTRNDKYPFAELLAPVNGQCDGFFVAATAKMPNPAKSLASAVNAATRKYAKIIGVSETLTVSGKPRNLYENTRKFKVVPHTADGVFGAFVARIL